MLVCCLALQTPLEQTQQLHPQTRVLAFADDCYLQGPPRHAVAAFHSLCNLAATCSCTSVACIDMTRRPLRRWHRSSAFHAKAGLMACSTPLGTPPFIMPFLATQTEWTCSLIGALFALSTRPQDCHLALRSTLQPRWITSRSPCPGPCSKPRSWTLHTPSCTVRVPQAPPRMTHKDDQLALPLRHGGVGFRRMAARKSVAAQLSAAALIQVAMRQGPSEFSPSNGPNRPLLQSVWEI
jgi:hypothetical protein